MAETYSGTEHDELSVRDCAVALIFTRDTLDDDAEWNKMAHADLAAAFARAPPQRRHKSWLDICLTRSDWRSFISGLQHRDALS